MADDNKPMKYMRYAAGEIALVVIGILIALQINNWNEERKIQKEELSLIKDIRSNLLENRAELEKGLKLNAYTLENYKIIFDHIQSRQNYTAGLDTCFGVLINWHSPFFTKTAYETLKTKGMDIIRNEELRSKITHIYEMDFTFLIEDYDKVEWTFAQSVKEPIVNKYFRQFPIDDKLSGARPFDYKLLLIEPDFMNMLSRLMIIRSGGVFEYKRVLTNLNNLLTVIDDELKKRNTK